MRIIYFYGNNSFVNQNISIVHKNDIISYEEGVSLGYNKPPAKNTANMDDKFLRDGLLSASEELKLSKEERVDWLKLEGGAKIFDLDEVQRRDHGSIEHDQEVFEEDKNNGVIKNGFPMKGGNYDGKDGDKVIFKGRSRSEEGDVCNVDEEGEKVISDLSIKERGKNNEDNNTECKEGDERDVEAISGPDTTGKKQTEDAPIRRTENFQLCKLHNCNVTTPCCGIGCGVMFCEKCLEYCNTNQNKDKRPLCVKCNKIRQGKKINWKR